MIDQLPTELVLMIAQRLNPKDILALSQTTKKLVFLSLSLVYWEKLDHNEKNKQLAYLNEWRGSPKSDLSWLGQKYKPLRSKIQINRAIHFSCKLLNIPKLKLRRF